MAPLTEPKHAICVELHSSILCWCKLCEDETTLIAEMPFICILFSIFYFRFNCAYGFLSINYILALKFYNKID